MHRSVLTRLARITDKQVKITDYYGNLSYQTPHYYLESIPPKQKAVGLLSIGDELNTSLNGSHPHRQRSRPAGMLSMKGPPAIDVPFLPNAKGPVLAGSGYKRH